MTKKEYRLLHKDEIKKYKKNYDDNHRKEISDYSKLYGIKNKEIIKIRNKNYRETHKANFRKWFSHYRFIKRMSNIHFKILGNLRTRIWLALKGINKSKSTIKLLGCSVEQLKKHLESKFTEGMSFTNYGKWHIDHIKPCAKFDLSKPSEQRRCFHYTNLQPLWARDNIIKSDSF